MNYPQATIAYNTALEGLVATGEVSAIADWHSAATVHADNWFVDAKHMNPDGYRSWAAIVGNTFANR